MSVSYSQDTAVWCDPCALPRAECGHALQDTQNSVQDGEQSSRHLHVQVAADIVPERVSWLWQGRMALGHLSLLAGREGLGKSTLAAWITAQVTRGTLPGDLYGQPRSVIIVATEDSWAHTLVPRLMAAGADLSRVLNVTVETSDGFMTGLSLPKDITALAREAEARDVALMVLDPITSRLENLDTHKDAEVRRALEPLVAMGDRVGMSVLGLIHLNKSSADPLNAVMGSKAFTAVARSVSTVVADPEDEDDRRRLFGTVKNNLGPALPASEVFTVESCEVEGRRGAQIITGRLDWHGSSATTIKSAMADPGMEVQGALGEAAEWLEDYLSMHPGTPRVEVIRDAEKAGHKERTVKRAANVVGVLSRTEGFPRQAVWSLSAQSGQAQLGQSGQAPPGESVNKGLTGPTGRDQHKQSEGGGSVGPVGPSSGDVAPLLAQQPMICPGCNEPGCDGDCLEVDR
ncbi:AAA family ATPase [Brachybacterium sp. UMB0905]|uniref:AAA family ATPase n=1 Tax=Brachybacterium sp. UMB0905 TaxID=2069310 RepID=UPI000C7FED78|nr:AAA family ATPase [Brachybacterium sp. UMB0905]PMC75533.1 hypothetical protein CJ197_07225 [Brachybacterium sp. UMB0905]